MDSGGSTGSIFAIFRSMLEEGSSGMLSEKIEMDLKNYDREIEKICNVSYEGFVESIHELIHVKSQLRSLRDEIIQLNNIMTAMSSNLIITEENIFKYRLTEGNLSRAFKQLQKCLPVFECCSKFSYYSCQNRYYESLKILEALENECLPTVYDHRFSIQMKRTIPKYKTDIKTLSDCEFREFLTNIRKFSSKIGDVSMRYTACMQKQNIKNILTGYKNIQPDISAYDLIDFSPIFKTYRIYIEIGYKDDFEKYYRTQRKDQIKLVLAPPHAMCNELDIYKHYITAVVGFFVVEDHVRNTAEEIASKLYLEDLWLTSLNTFATNLEINIYNCTDPNVLLKIEMIIVLALNNLKLCGYMANHLWDLLFSIKDHYNEVLLQRWVYIFQDILKKEDFVPLEVGSLHELDTLMEKFPYSQEMYEANEMPQVLPFSKMVPTVYNEIKEFIYASIKYCQCLPILQDELALTVKKSANLLLASSFRGCISATLTDSSLNLTQVLQAIVDIKHLEGASSHLDEFISDITGTQANNKISLKIFQSDYEAENEVNVRICSKVEDFFGISDYNWLLTEPSGNASTFISDMISYLATTFQSIAQMLPLIAQNTCKKVCKHISENIIKLLLDKDIKIITSAAIQQINLDLMQCEFFAASKPVPGLKETEITRQFLTVRQLLDLLIMEEWSTYLHDYGKKENRYYKVEPKIVISILEKMREADKKTMFTVLKKNERDKKKLREAVLKQLYNLTD